MKSIFSFLFSIIFSIGFHAQTIDTLAIQDFELAPITPTWNFTGPVVYNSGTSLPTAAPASSPIGIGSSRAWESTTVSGGLVLEFDNVIVPVGYDSVLFEFRLAAMNLNGSSGGPDHLDYVLVEYSTDGGTTYYGRLRIRGAAANNGFWAYSATGLGKVYYQPTTEVMFQPANSGLATTDGYSTNGITFPGTVSQIRIRMTGRSSSSTDSWLVDNVLLTGVNSLSTKIDEFNENNLSLYPNPTTGLVNVKMGDTDNTYEVFDLVGNRIISRSNEAILNLSNYPNGIYFITSYSKKENSTKKIIKY